MNVQNISNEELHNDNLKPFLTKDVSIHLCIFLFQIVHLLSGLVQDLDNITTLKHWC